MDKNKFGTHTIKSLFLRDEEIVFVENWVDKPDKVKSHYNRE